MASQAPSQDPAVQALWYTIFGSPAGVANTPFNAPNDIILDATGTSTGAPRTIGLGLRTFGNYVRLSDTGQGAVSSNGLQVGWGTRLQLYSYWGMEIRGKQQATTPVFNNGGAGDQTMMIFPSAITDSAIGVSYGSAASAPFLALTNPLTATTVGAAGGAAAPPATPTGYLVFSLGGTNFKIPYYAN